MSRSDIYWADLPAPIGRRPVCILTREAALDVLNAVTCAPITTTRRGIESEVEVGPSEGLSRHGVISCDNVLTVAKEVLDREPVGKLGLAKRIELDQALRYALDIIF